MASKAQIKAALAKAGAKAQTAATVAANTASGFVAVPRERVRPLALFLASLPVGVKVRIPDALFAPEDLNVKSGANAGEDLGYRLRKSITDVYSAVDGGMRLHEDHALPPFLWVSDYSRAGDTAPVLAVRVTVPKKTRERLAREGKTPGDAALSLPLDETEVNAVLATFSPEEVSAYLDGLAQYADEADEADDETPESGSVF